MEIKQYYWRYKHEKIKVLLLWQRNKKRKTFPQNVFDR